MNILFNVLFLIQYSFVCIFNLKTKEDIGMLPIRQIFTRNVTTTGHQLINIDHLLILLLLLILFYVSVHVLQIMNRVYSSDFVNNNADIFSTNTVSIQLQVNGLYL